MSATSDNEDHKEKKMTSSETLPSWIKAWSETQPASRTLTLAATMLTEPKIRPKVCCCRLHIYNVR